MYELIHVEISYRLGRVQVWRPLALGHETHARPGAGPDLAPQASHNYNHFEKMNWEKVLVFANEGLKSINFLNN